MTASEWRLAAYLAEHCAGALDPEQVGFIRRLLRNRRSRGLTPTQFQKLGRMAVYHLGWHHELVQGLRPGGPIMKWHRERGTPLDRLLFPPDLYPGGPPKWAQDRGVEA